MKNPLAIGLLVVAIVVVQASGQTALNPTVKVLPRPQSPVPAECADGVTSTQPSQLANEVPEPEPELPPQPASGLSSVPPSNELRTFLRRAQVAAAGEDYAAFKAAVADVRRAVATYPAGGERNAASDAMRVYTDVARVWDYAMASPTGSFFDNTAQGGSLINALKRYPDYGRALAEETVTVGGKTLYPTRETRRFLVRESARHLARLGVSVSPREPAMTQTERVRPTAVPPVKQTTAAPPKKQTRPKSEPKTAEVKAVPKPHTAKHTPARTAKASSPKPATPRIESTPVPKAKPEEHAASKIAATATATPAKPPAASTNTGGSPLPVPATSIVPPPIVATSLPPATTTPSATTSSTTTPGTTTIGTTATGTTTAIATTASTDTTDTAAPDTATTGTAVPAEKQNGNMNLILAIVLILVGIGVLVVLFRASD